MSKLLKVLTNPKHLISSLDQRNLFRWVPDKIYLRIKYKSMTGRKLNLKQPERFNEKLQWLKLNDRRKEYICLVDKYEVKKHVESVLGEGYTFKTLGIYNSFDEILFDKLPEKFVIKTTHDSKGVVICKDKSKFDYTEAKRFIGSHLRKNGFDFGREWPYKKVKHRILVEEYMEDSSGELKDYKVMCFGGIPKLIQVHSGRFKEKHTQDLYDTDWNLLPVTQGLENSGEKTEPPVFLSEILRLSGVLAKNIPQIRIDWYYTNNHLYLGEMTFFDASGFDDFGPDEWNLILGSWIVLPRKGI